MGILSWLTGRDEKESDVYANFERVDEVVTSLKKVSTDTVTDAAEAVRAAVTELNQAKGMAEFVGQVNVDSFTPTFERVTSTIDQVATMIQQKADNIKVYEESKWYEKLGSTFAMAGAKFGEGILSVVEDLGDGVVSLVGWVAPKDSGVEKWCSDFVQKEWSHDTFNFYYNSEFAKKSTFTEDSAIAGAFKIGGQVATYMFAGGLVAGAGKAKAAGTAVKAANAATKTGKVAKTVATVSSKVGGVVSKVGGLASASTWGATAVAGVAGMGSGTETGLRNGLDFDSAARGGVKQGAFQAALAFAGGKLGEKMAKSAALKGANQTLDDAANNMTKTLSNTTDDALRNAGKAATQASDDLMRAAANSTDDAVKAAAKAVANTSDDVLKAAATTTDDAVLAANKAVTNATDDLVKAAANSTDDAIKAAGKVATQASDDLAKAVANTTDDAIKTAQKAFTNASDDLAKAVAKNAGDDVINAAKEAVTKAGDDVARAIANSTDDAVKAASKAVSNATDDLVKAAANSSDDVIKAAGKVVTNASDDLTQAIAKSGDKAIKAATKAANNANMNLTKAIANTTDDAVKVANEAATKAAGALDDAIANTTDDLVKQASKNLDDALDNVLDVQKSKLSSYEGYDDVISRSGRDVGEKAMNNVIQKGFIKGTGANVAAVTKATVNAGGSALKTAGNAIAHPIQTAKTVGNTAWNAVKTTGNAVVHPINTVKTVGGAAITAAVQNPGAVAQTVNAGINYAQSSDNIADLAGLNVEVTGPTPNEINEGYTDPTGADIPAEQQYRMGTDTPTGETPTGTTPSGTPSGGTPSGGTPSGGTPSGGDTGGNTGGDTGGNTGGNTGGTNPGGYTGPSDETVDETHTGSGFGEDEFSGTPFEIDEGFGDEGDEFDSLADIIANGDKLTEIPSSSTPIKAESKGGASAVIPIAAGLSAAAAAGIGAKVFMDRKNNAENDEDDEFDTDDWSEDGQIEIDYEESEGSIADQYLNDDDDYGYQANTGEKYGARTSEELADLQ